MNFDSLRLLDLKKIALNCGSPLAGTKKQVIANLEWQFARLQNVQGPVISLDLGLKNIGFCLIQQPSLRTIPEIRQWSRLSFDSQNRQPELARHVISFAESLLAAKPATILIEKQRSRTMGGAAVPDNILRMVVFEGMLHTALASRSPETQVVSVDPKSVVAFWRDRLRLEKTKTYKESKQLRVNIVENWIKEGAIDFGSCELGRKKDDMCDALVQAVAWLKWRQAAIAGFASTLSTESISSRP